MEEPPKIGNTKKWKGFQKLGLEKIGGPGNFWRHFQNLEVPKNTNGGPALVVRAEFSVKFLVLDFLTQISSSIQKLHILEIRQVAQKFGENFVDFFLRQIAQTLFRPLDKVPFSHYNGRRPSAIRETPETQIERLFE